MTIEFVKEVSIKINETIVSIYLPQYMGRYNKFRSEFLFDLDFDKKKRHFPGMFNIKIVIFGFLLFGMSVWDANDFNE
jgi:hypothetical protein